MCGIAGLFRTDGAAVDPAVLERLTEMLRHRGPDGLGLHVEGPAGLGHRRLAIIDLEGGRQPLANEDGTIWVSCNGEIYNYRQLTDELTAKGHAFRTRSDTEVLVHAYEEWGDAFLERLRGMFALALWDGRAQRLLLARDRFGIKPLCYFVGPGMIAFASEMQAFRALPGFTPTVDLAALDLYLHFQYIPAPHSIYREVRKLPPAHYLVVDRAHGLQEPRPYWSLAFRPDRRPSEEEWIERLDAGLRETVEAHLVADVPFGAFLSGGVDSSAVVAYMSALLDQPVRTFTVGYEGSEHDERIHAREVAERLGTEHHEILVDRSGLDILPALVEHYGEPFADSSAISTYFVSRLARRHVKMVLSGDGGDEIFAGYEYFEKILRAHGEPRSWPRRVRRRVGDVARRLGALPPMPYPPDTWYQFTPYFNEGQRRRLWRREHHDLLAGTRRWNDEQFERAGDTDLLSRCQHVDIHNFLPYDNLTKVDVASMSHGLEVRVPFLDPVFIDLVCAIPDDLKLRPPEDGPRGTSGGSVATGKYILRKTVERFFRPGFLDRRKRGFSVPIEQWLAEDAEGLRARLTSGASGLRDLFEPRYIQGLLEEHAVTRRHGWRLWALLYLDEWMEQNRRARPDSLAGAATAH